MAASGRTEVASDVKFGVGASVIELYLGSKFGDPSSYSVPTLKPSRRKHRMGYCQEHVRPSVRLSVCRGVHCALWVNGYY